MNYKQYKYLQGELTVVSRKYLKHDWMGDVGLNEASIKAIVKLSMQAIRAQKALSEQFPELSNQHVREVMEEYGKSIKLPQTHLRLLQ